MTEREFMVKKLPEIIRAIGPILISDSDEKFSSHREMIYKDGGWWLVNPSHVSNTPVLAEFAIPRIKDEIRQWLADRGISIRAHNRDGKTHYTIRRRKGLNQLYYSYVVALYTAIKETKVKKTVAGCCS